MNANFRGKGASLPMIFGTSKVESLGYRMVKKIAEKFNRLSRVHQRHRQTDRRQTTDGRLIAYSERNEVRSLKKRQKRIYIFLSLLLHTYKSKHENVVKISVHSKTDVLTLTSFTINIYCFITKYNFQDGNRSLSWIFRGLIF